MRRLIRPLGGTGRRCGLKIRRRKACGFEPRRGHALVWWTPYLVDSVTLVDTPRKVRAVR